MPTRLVEESREIVVVLDDEPSRRRGQPPRTRGARWARAKACRFPRPLPARAGERRSRCPTRSTGTRETLLYLSGPGDLAAYEELRAGFTAAVSHELRTPLARLLALLESALAAGRRPARAHRRRRDARSSSIARADRRRALPQRARDGPRGRRARARSARCRCSRRSSPSSRPAARARGRAARVDCPALGRAAAAPADAAGGRARTSPRTRSATPGEGATFTLDVPRRAHGARVLDAADDGVGRGGRGPAAAVRALLPRRPGARLARHRARARDRQARRHGGGRHGRGASGTAGRAQHPCAFPANVV